MDMVAPLDLSLEEELADILTRAFGSGRRTDYDALSSVTSKVGGWTLGQRIGSDAEPMVTLVTGVLRTLTQEGPAKCEAALSELVRVLPGNRELRIWIARRRPQLLDLVPQGAFEAAERELQTLRVASVSGALGDLQAFSGMAKLVDDKARHDLALAAESLRRLSICKGLHDILHGVQTGAYAQLSPLIRRADGLTAEDLDAIAFHVITLQTAKERIDTNLRLLGDDDTDWVRSFEEAVALLGPLTPDMETFRASLFALRAVLRQQLPAFAHEILDAASDIPFGGVIEFLDQAEGLKNHLGASIKADGRLKVAAQDLAALDYTLKRTLRIHERWQMVDSGLWPIEQELQSPDGGLDLIKFHWRAISRALDTLRQSAPDMWDGNLDRARSQVDEVLTATRSDATTAALAAFVRVGRLQFLRVDKAVLEQCTQIDALRRPLEQLLKGA